MFGFCIIDDLLLKIKVIANFKPAQRILGVYPNYPSVFVLYTVL